METTIINQGLTQHQWQQFSDLLPNANISQLMAMEFIISQELKLRGITTK